MYSKILLFMISFFCLNLKSVDPYLSTLKKSSICVVGGQWGDEGKGKIVDCFAKYSDLVVRAQGGNNAGHTLVIGDKEYKLHLIPSGVLYSTCQCYIAGGTVIDPEVLLKEIKSLEDNGIKLKGRLWISPNANIIMPYHKLIDKLSEEAKGSSAIGTTGRGIGPCYSDRTNRIGIQLYDLIDKDRFNKKLDFVLSLINKDSRISSKLKLDYVYDTLKYGELLKPYVKHNMEFDLSNKILSGKRVLFEGAQGTFLDVNFGTVPFVTSSNTIAAGVCAGAGVGPTAIGKTTVVFKSYLTRVGNGPFSTEFLEKDNFLDYSKDREHGTTTGRKRRAGWFDAVLGKYSVALNGADEIALTKLDILDKVPKIKVCVAYKVDGKLLNDLDFETIRSLDKVEPVYEDLPGWNQSTTHIRKYEDLPGWNQSTTHIRKYEDLPENARKYIERISELCGAPINIISVGPDRDQTIFKF